MNFTETIKEGQHTMTDIVRRCWEDETFKNKLIASPKEAIEEFTGGSYNLKEGFTLKVEDQTDANVIYLNIPKKINIDDLELTEEELEAVSGGVIGIDDILVGIAAAALYDFGSGLIDGLIGN